MCLSGLRLVSSQLRRPTHTNTIIRPDQGVYASNRHAETNIGREALGLELDPLAEHGSFPCNFPRLNISSGNRGIVPGKSTKVYLAD